MAEHKFAASRFSVAPMLDWTDRHCRVFHRCLTKNALLYTEMVTTGAILFGNQEKLLGYNNTRHPIALQLGGSDPEDLARCVRIARQYGYDEFNLNCGCPSERVQKGAFGASLMLDAPLVARCYQAMQSATQRPVTIKHRIGVDKEDRYRFVRDFVGTVYEAGCRRFIVHTRAAWLQGLSPKENREIPPLKREYAVQLKKDFPRARFSINGALGSIARGLEWLDQGLDGMMLGRAAYHNPWLLTDVDARVFGQENTKPLRSRVVEQMTAYLVSQWADDRLAIRATARHMMGLTQGLPGARRWRQILSDPKAFRRHGPTVLSYAWEQTYGSWLEENERPR